MRWLAFLLASVALAQNPQPPITPATSGTISITNSVTRTIPAQYLGLSYPKSWMIASPYILSAGNPRMKPIFQNMGCGVIRFVSVDTLIYTPAGVGHTGGQISNGDINSFATFINSLGCWSVIYTLSYQNSANDAAEAAYVSTALGSHLANFAIGNEPDNGGDGPGLTPSTFAAGWNTIANAVITAVPTAHFSAPDLAQTNNVTSWDGALISYVPGSGLSNAALLGSFSQHYYIDSAANLTLTEMLNPYGSGGTNGWNNMRSQVPPLLSAHPLPFRLTEMNSAYNGGALNLSNTFASALYAIDISLNLAQTLNASSVNFTSGGSGSNGNVPYSPIDDTCTPSTVPCTGATVYGWRPEYAGFLLMQAAGLNAGASMLSTTPTISGVNLTAYTIQAGSGPYQTFVINKDQTANAAITLTYPVTMSTVTGQYLYDATGLTDQNAANIHIQGVAPAAGTGAYTPGASYTYALTGTSVTVYLNKGSAMLLTGTAASAPPVIIPITLLGTTNTQAIIQYTAPDSGVCTVSGTPANPATWGLHDLDPTLYTNANIDSRWSQIAQGLVRTAVIGERDSKTALDGNSYSRALAASWPYTVNLSCDSGNATGSVTFTTANQLLGNSAPDPPQYDAAQWDGWSWPTVFYGGQSQEQQYPDPKSGMILQRLTSPGEDSVQLQATCPANNVVDQASAWTTPSNITCTATSAHASYAGSAGSAAALFLWPNQTGVYRPSFIPDAWDLADDLQLTVTGHGSDANEVLHFCLSYNYGQSCLGSTVTMTLPATTDAAQTVPGSFPNPLFGGWGNAHVTMDMLSNNFGGLANVSGTSVTWASNSQAGYNATFPVTVLQANDAIILAGTTYKIASIQSETQLTLTSSAGTGTNVAYSFPNWGVLMWKTGPGTASVASVNGTLASSASMSVGDQGAEAPYCSSATVTVSFAADGVTPITPVPGYTCLFQSSWGNLNLYLFIPSTGESRHIVNLSGSALLSNYSQPTQFYEFNNSSFIISNCTYNVAGNWKSIPAYGNGSNTNWGCTPVPMGGNTVAQEIAAAYPNLDQTYFGGPTLQSSNCPGGTSTSPCLFLFQLRPAQGALAWYCTIDTGLAAGATQVTNCFNTWSNYPARWTGSHGSGFYSAPGYQQFDTQTPLLDMGTTGIEQWNMAITTIYNNGGSTALTNSFVDPSGTCQGLVTAAGGGTIASYLASQIPGGASANNCIRINVPNDPAATSPNAADLVPLGSLPVGSRPAPCSFNASWSCLTSLQDGDEIYDSTNNSSGDEHFLVLARAVVGSTLDFVLARGLSPFGCGAAPAPHLTAHSSGWIPAAYPPMSCGNQSLWIPNSTSPSQSTTLIDDPLLYTAHVNQWTTSTGINQIWEPYSWTSFPNDVAGFGAYAIRQAVIPSGIGSPASYGAQDLYGFGAPGQSMNFQGVGINEIQSHPGGNQPDAPITEQVWGVDGRPLGSAGGGSQLLWPQAASLVSGQSQTYLMAVPSVMTFGGWTATPNAPKLREISAFAGFHLLKDISGPSSVISDSTPWTYCIVQIAGECVSGSAQYNVYVSVPAANTGGNCQNDGTINGLCAAMMPSSVGNYTQYGINQSDPQGLFWRNQTALFEGPGRTGNYANMHGLLTGDWNIGASNYSNGQRGDVWAVRNTAWPSPDSVARNQYEVVPVLLPGVTGSTVRARFGYGISLFCTSRQEQCSTAVSNSDPFAYLSESQTWTSCASSCQVNIPAIAGRVLYYVIDRQIGGVTTSSPITVQAVN